MTTRIRLIGVTAAALALVAGASAAVSAQPDDDTPFPFGRGRLELRHPGDMGGPLFRGGRGGFGGGLMGRFDGLVRQETTYETDDGLVTRRIDNGTLVSISGDTVEYSLADGQTASASIDEDTEIIAFAEKTVEVGHRGLMRQRMTAQEVDPTSIAAGSDILVWAESSGDGAFAAQRLVVQPEAESAEGATESPAPVTDDATASPAPEVSPASA